MLLNYRYLHYNPLIDARLLCCSLQMRSSNYIKFVTRCCWASPGYCINIDAGPEISQCIYSLTTPDCLLDRNMGAGSRWELLSGERSTAVHIPKRLRSTRWLFCECLFVASRAVRPSDWRWYQLWLDCHPMKRFHSQLQSCPLCGCIPVTSCTVATFLLLSQ